MIDHVICHFEQAGCGKRKELWVRQLDISGLKLLSDSESLLKRVQQLQYLLRHYVLYNISTFW